MENVRLTFNQRSLIGIRFCKYPCGGIIEEGSFFIASIQVATDISLTANQSLPFLLKDIRTQIQDRIIHKKCFDPGQFAFWSPSVGLIAREDESSVPWSWMVVSEKDRWINIISPEGPSTFYLQNGSGLFKRIFLTRDEPLGSLRKEIQAQALDTENLALESFRWPKESFTKVDHEAGFHLSDVVDKKTHTIRIATRSSGGILVSSPRSADLKDTIDEESSGLQPANFFMNEPTSAQVKRRKGLETPKRVNGQTNRVSFNSSRVVSKSATPLSSASAKKFLISYVKDESIYRASLLKKELEKLGADVFLDIDNIVAGMDWQDTLNDAVSACEVFLPIVSESYGERLWTNREIKLADVLGKTILPVSVIDFWPPAPLAIQFATTQYIRWFSENDFSAPTQTPEEVENNRARNVAKQIIEMDRGIQDGQASDRILANSNVVSPIIPSVFLRNRRRSTLRSYPEVLTGVSCKALEDARRPREGPALVVICAHPEQADVVERIRMIMDKDKYEVWSTTYLREIWSEEPERGRVSATGEIDGLTAEPRISTFSGSSQETKSSLSPSCDSLSGTVFQEQADQAGIVIVVLSGAFANARACKSFFYYVELRKRLVLIKYADFSMPCWMPTLMGGRQALEYNSSDFECNIRSNVRRALKMSVHSEFVEEDVTEGPIQKGIAFLIRKKLPQNRTVYIASTGSQPKRAEFLSRKIATELSKLPYLCIANGGDLAVGEAFSSHFAIERQKISPKSKPSDSVFHILPLRDNAKQTDLAGQNEDGTFNAASPGMTFFIGQSMRERESIVGRYFRVCILIDGDARAAHEASEAKWANNCVLPICKSGGAAGGDFDFRIGEAAPVGISEQHWQIIRNTESDDGEIAISVREIIEVLLPDTAAKPIKRPRTPRTPRGAQNMTPPYGLRNRKLTGHQKRSLEDTKDTLPEEKDVNSTF